MNTIHKLPPFGTFLDALRAAGVQTGTARGFWGGVDEHGEIVVTSWIDQHDENRRFYIWKPLTNHGGLKAQWEIGNMRPGTEVRMILLRQRGQTTPLGVPRQVKDAVLMPGKWRITETTENEDWQAVIEQVA